MTSADGSPVIGVSPFVSVSSLISAVRRNWNLLVALAVGGLIAGLAVSVFLPPPYTATTTVLLQQPSGSDTQRAMFTEVALLKTRAVAQGAVDQAHLRVSAKDLLSQYDGAPLSDQILTVTAQATTSAEAVRRADAVTTSYLAFRRTQLQQQLTATVQAIHDRQNPLVTELASLDQQIKAYDASTQTDPIAVRALSDLLTHRTQVADQVTTLQRQIDQDTLNSAQVIGASRVIDPAVDNNRSAAKKALEYALAGLVLALMVAIGGIAVREVISEAARKRVDVATALGVPVAVSVGALRRPRGGRRRHLKPDAIAPTPGLSPIVAHLRRVLDGATGSPRALLVVPVGKAWPATLTVAALADELAEAGTNVLLVDYSKTADLATSARNDARIRVLAPTGDATGGSHSGLGDSDVVLVLSGLDPEIGADHLRSWAPAAVAVVTAGHATPTALYSAAHMLRAGEIDLVSAVLVGADRSDETLGVPRGAPVRPAPQRSRGGAAHGVGAAAGAPAPTSGTGP